MGKIRINMKKGEKQKNKLKNYGNYKKKEKNNILTWVIGEAIFIFIVATATIILYDMYINIDVTPHESYIPEKVAKEVNVENTSDISETIENTSQSVVGISKIVSNDAGIFSINSEKTLSLGSGIIITDNGYILTNEHVSGGKYSKCYVTIAGEKEEYQGTVIWADSDIDLSIIKIEKLGLIPAKLGNSDKIKIANKVYAIGNPIGVEFERTVTAGIISAVDRTIKLKEDEEYSYMEDLIQTDATINSGNSGGPLVNENGEVIGINTVKIQEAEGIGFAIPINLVKPILQKIKTEGGFIESSIGIYAYDREVIQYLEENLSFETGIYIVSVNKDGPADKKGILVGDIITKIDNVELNKMSDLRKYIYTKNPKDKVMLMIERKGRNFGVEIELGKK